MGEWFIDFLTLSAQHPAFVIVAVALCTFVLEDAATVGAALLAAEGILPVPAAIAGLFIGITLGDLGLYGLGALARRWQWAASRIGTHRLGRGQDWLAGRLLPAIFLARVTPGLRVPSYLASGYLGVSFIRFASLAVIAVGAWSMGAFALVFYFGQVAQAWLGQFSWIAGITLLAAVISWPYILRWRTKS